MKKLTGDRHWFGYSPLVTLGALLSLVGSGCMSMQSQTTLDAIQGALGQNATYVEGYVEYPGPQAKWAGPSSMLLHVTAKDQEEVKVTTVPEIFSQAVQLDERSKKAGKDPYAAPMSREQAREHLGRLAVAAQESGQGGFHGCLYPVRVRLIRADGSLLERQGCRGQTAWTRVASDIVDEFVAINAYPTRQPNHPQSLAEKGNAPAEPSKEVLGEPKLAEDLPQSDLKKAEVPAKSDETERKPASEGQSKE